MARGPYHVRKRRNCVRERNSCVSERSNCATPMLLLRLHPLHLYGQSTSKVEQTKHIGADIHRL